MLTEAELIRTYQPEFNVALKDDKSPLYIHITKEQYPKVEQVRKKDIQKYARAGKVFGPFHSAYKVHEVLKLVRPIFTWCNLKSKTGRPCFYYHIEQCSGACINKITPEEYQETIAHLSHFLQGKTNQVVENLQQAMKQASAAQQFEKAATIRDQIDMITVITKDHYRLKPQLTGLTANDSVDGNIFLQKILTDYLSLPKNYPLSRIEGYDVSNLFGKQASVAQVVFIEGKKSSSEYRLFNIKMLNTPNDYQMMKEAIVRRQNHPEWGTPDLIVIDGGKGQLRAALSVWQWDCPVISIAKKPDRIIIPKVHWPQVKKANQVINIKGLTYYVIKLEDTHPALKLIQQIRDESHRFSKKQHKRRRDKDFLKNE